MLALVDYGAGNLTSVRKAFAAIGAELFTPEAPAALGDAAAIVVPGVGHFAATASLERGWRPAIRDAARRGVPVLGICLGMQWLYEGSDEAPEVPGLGILEGRCTKLAAAAPLKVPHVGWNGLTVVGESPLLEGIPSGAHVYFTHSFQAPVTADTLATAAHGTTFAAIVGRGSTGGVQFHPEKSGPAGLRLLRNFVEMARAR